MEKILIVEDDPNIRESLQEIFELAGYQTKTSCNGREGYDSIIEEFPDLVVCDVDMPELDGLELLGAINQRFKDKVVPPFVFLTAKVEPQDVRKGMSLGADDYILKPFDHLQVLDIVRMRLDKRKKLIGNGSTNKHATSTNNKLALPSDEGLVLVPYSEIIKCQADRAYCTFYLTSGKKILVSKSMKEYEDLLVAHDFLKVHKSTIVNMNFVEKYIKGKGGQLMMSDGSMVMVSVRKKDELMQILRTS